jgi:hypothetical protein
MPRSRFGLLPSEAGLILTDRKPLVAGVIIECDCDEAIFYVLELNFYFKHFRRCILGENQALPPTIGRLSGACNWVTYSPNHRDQAYGK